MEDNPLMEAFRKELTRQAEAAGFTCTPDRDSRTFSRDNQPIARLTQDGSLRNLTRSTEAGQRLFHPFAQMKQHVQKPYDLFRTAPEFYCGIPHCRALCEFDNVVLAARVDGDGRMQFSTWLYQNGRLDVGFPHHCGTDFTAAKEYFTIRAGLAPQARLFSVSEMEQLAQACAYRLSHDDNLSWDSQELLVQSKERLQKTSIRKRADLEKAQAGQELGIQQTGVPMGLLQKRTEPGYLLTDGTALLESERDEAGNYLGGAGMDGMYLKTGRRYAPVLNGDGTIRAFRALPNPPQLPQKPHKRADPQR